MPNQERGLGIHLVMTPTRNPPIERQVFFENRYGEGQGVTFYLSDKDEFTFAVFDRNGAAYSISVPATDQGFPLDILSWFALEAEPGNGVTMMRVSRNGRALATRDIPFEIDLGIVDAKDAAIGGSRQGGKHSKADIFEIIVYRKMLHGLEQKQMEQHIRDKFREIL